MRVLLFLLMGFAASVGSAGSVRAADEPSKAAGKPPARIGVYDSRAVAYAHFHSEAERKKRDAVFVEATAAKKKGDTKKLDELKAASQQAQRRIHRCVFSTAPADEAVESLRARLPELCKQAGVEVLVSKWDQAKLKAHASAQQVDVTDRLVREFKPTDKQLKVIAEIQKAKPVSLEDAEKCR